MAKINILDKSVYNRISAGEVVERPASVVKELIENSIDAKATEIEISILSGGKDSIVISDNGYGIEKDELGKVFLPHATSKIKDVKDLENICTLGFRGEAIASVSAVSKVSVSSVFKGQEVGYNLTCNGGEIGEVKEVAIQEGTTFTVENLFYNTPVREKFLKTAKTEENEITNIVTRYVLANPDIAFKYVADGKTVLQSFGSGFEDAMVSVYGVQIIKDCFFIQTVKNGIKIEGYVGKHYFTKPNRTYQTIILNERYIINNTIQLAINNAYASYLMKRQYPFYVLKIEVDPKVVDVNVHPNKADVRFQDNQIIYGSIYSVISKVLDGSSQAVEIVKSTGEDRFFNTSNNENNIEKENRFSQTSKETIEKSQEKNYEISPKVSVDKTYKKDTYNNFFSSFVVADSKSESQTESDADKIFEENKKYIQELEQKAKEKEKSVLDIPLSLKYVGQLLNTYLVFEQGDSLVLVDQHALHERLIYDVFVEKVKNRDVEKQSLLLPYKFVLSNLETEYFFRKIDYVRQIGFEIEYTDENTFEVFAIPMDLVEIDLKAFFGDILGDLSLKSETIPEMINEKLMQKACKSAIKSGKVLRQIEVDSLIKKLDGKLGLKCPHGRPVAVKISRTEIDKWFKRIV